ncbi:uncharacterized protein LOC125470903 isoform X1 [Pyrus x bretschneideri]|uniref:uncharacterized protein LOC125470903 isoform X1 n=1 Tax=Pyrus x bretschneideri TaxID=225117 RepID=UPI00202E2DC9|nr:uncharacterized protein LOC125470903 isoform X1 [Pyrus x bretschneideri]
MAEASSASATKSDEEKIEMLDQLLTRLALCNDSSLQPLLSKLLPFTISAPSSQSSAVRNKILSFSSKYIATQRFESVANGCRRRGKQTGLPQTGWAAIRPIKEPEGMLPLEGGKVQSPPFPFSPQRAPGAAVATRSQWDDLN